MLVFTLWAASGYRLVRTPLIYIACFYSLGGVWISIFVTPSRLRCLFLLVRRCLDIYFSHPSPLLCLFLLGGRCLDIDFCRNPLVYFACFYSLDGVWISTFPHPSHLLCVFLLFGRCLGIDFFTPSHLLWLFLLCGRCLDIIFFAPLSSTSLVFTLWAVSGYRFFHTPLIYVACLYSLAGV